ncbi:MAG: aminotransferase class III-fold pyridoxal phosphate-dependent enzyme, partial [Chlamydiota bacterium]
MPRTERLARACVDAVVSHPRTVLLVFLVCAAALAVFKTIRKEKLLHQAQVMGEYFGRRLESLKAKYSFIEKVKGMA